MWASAWVCLGVPGATHVASPIPSPTPTGLQPQMPGIVSNCKKYYYVQSGDRCWIIEQVKGVSLQLILSWNKGINSDCTNMWAHAYNCIGM